MARIAGVNIPTNKRVEIALTYIYGIGRVKAKEICEKVGLPAERRAAAPAPAAEHRVRRGALEGVPRVTGSPDRISEATR